VGTWPDAEVELCFPLGVLHDQGRREAKLRKLAWIALGLLLASFHLHAQQSQPSEETTPPEQKSSAQGKDINDLKGDKLGESLDVFKANHPKLQCKKRDSQLTDCHVWDGVSIAGVTVRGVEKCSSEASDSAPTVNCMQGIDAHFVSELLAGLSYLVEGDDGSKGLIVSAFKQEYGPPTSEGQDQVMWSNDALILSITLLKPNSKISYVAVTLDLKPSEVGEDI
jgi:hypothetical protein